MNKSLSYYDKLSFLRKRFMLTFLFLLLSGAVVIVQENNTVTGTVTAQGDNLPLPGVDVIEVVTFNGYITKLERRYSISVREDGVLNFNDIEFESMEILADVHCKVYKESSKDYSRKTRG